MAKALITWGGWDGHEPDKVAAICADILTEAGMTVSVHDTLSCFDDAAEVATHDLIVPVWTMSTIEPHQAEAVSEAVARGTGLAGCHGGMCDAFRANVLWQFMTGANWVAHPGGDGVVHTITITDPDHPITEGIADFEVATEQYYLQTDPANRVLATTRFPVTTWYHSPNGPVDVPQVWTRRWGLGRVFYSALGHKAAIIASGPAHDLLRNGLLWAAQGRAAARDTGEAYEDYASAGKHF
ncbi:ThuA domain-containing protein [Roseisalinus antarcticus]|uniref:Trehalose utilization n=1 Tax=Roseisalinus antarcticus TaxID=254357 RepID=A0A1Y5STH2_9RHOB|nr:ThuA domain-containing protein [Roseisalinus antarcticus]SLN47461.1 Trehalose utilization [Roseisalinus antarcticus]